MKRLLVFLSLLILSANSVFAIDNSRPNNKFGIHMAVPDENDFKKAAELVNSSGGRWGYVTLVLQDNDLDKGKWQDAFNKMRRLRLIPIIRLATQPENGTWRRPEDVDATKFADFLESLNWVVKDRYIILFNEPNHGAEWGGATDPEGYAKVALAFTKKLKEKNKDYFVMLAGLDGSAPSQSPNFEDEGYYLDRIFTSAPELKDLINGLSSHAYPNPGFAGSPDDFGRGTIRTYEWELSYLKGLGVIKDLPVFITETGWSRNAVSEQTAADFIKQAFENVWLNDERVRAVTPFVLNYQGEPFTQFSYKKLGSDDFYQQFYSTQNIPKTHGDPERNEKGTITTNFPTDILVDSNYHFRFKMKNDGQGIWDKNDGYQIKLEGDKFESYFFSNLNGIEPGQETDGDLYFKTDEKEGAKKVRLALYKGDRKVLQSGEEKINVLPLPDLKIDVNIFPKLRDKASDFEVQIFDDKEEIVYKKKGVEVNNRGMATLEGVRNVYLGKKFRVVILKPYYLPRQKVLVFQKGVNEVKFKRLLPLDFDKDGNFDFKDLGTLITHPGLFGLIFP